MTHFTVAIIVPPEKLDPLKLDGFIALRMAPYDEDLVVDPYVCYSVEQAAADLAAAIHRLELVVGRRDEFFDIDKCRSTLEQLRRLTPEEHFHDRIRFHEDFNDNDEPISTFNPDGKWDWYVIGGRWDGWINDREATSEAVSDNLAATEEAVARKKVPHAIITPDGRWHEHGRLGWWANLLTENEDWDRVALEIMRQHPGHHVVILDAHV